MFILIPRVVFKIYIIFQENKISAFWNLVSNQGFPGMSVNLSSFKSSFTKCYLKKLPWKISELMLEPLFNIIYQEETLLQNFSCAFSELFQNSFLQNTKLVPKVYFRFKRKTKNLKLLWGRGWQDTSVRVILHLASITGLEILKTDLSWTSALPHLPNVSLYQRNSE